MSETLPTSPEECGGGASESEELREYVVDRSPTPSFRPPIIERPCPARMKKYVSPPSPLCSTNSSEIEKDIDLLYYESWGNEFLSEQNPRFGAKSDQSKVLELKYEESNEWWHTASEAHLKLLAIFCPMMFRTICEKWSAGRHETSLL
ncbi:uncharacterized protein LOC130985197 [Salvia miltiorrhiza]|uniref:uncharacterized protein LOC130985197 n=1 Tax=Salvia miltiorrhiza TaxID=226208 RepID=UPI0025AD42CB|nr:uncharacterized protein LOC130985197 [Salvia miltiorrhiza]